MPAEKGARIARGHTADLYEWPGDRVIKLFREDFADHAAHEMQVSRAAHDAGLPVPCVHGLVELEGRPGIVFERVRGPNLWDAFENRLSEAEQYARLLAELHDRLHAWRLPEGLPSVREVLRGIYRDNPDLISAFGRAGSDIMAALPDGDRVCHGDFYPRNIILAPGGPVVIDWAIALRGTSLADHARTWLLSRYVIFRSGKYASRQVHLAWRTFWESYMTRYRELRPYAESDLTVWIVAISMAALIVDDIPDLRHRLMAFITTTLQDMDSGKESAWSTATL